jgi:hypothetical protein
VGSIAEEGIGAPGAKSLARFGDKKKSTSPSEVRHVARPRCALKSSQSRFSLGSSRTWMLFPSDASGRKNMTKLLVCIASAIALIGCSSSTRIRVSDPDARIFVNGEYVGTGKGYYSDRKPAFSKQQVTLRKEGCEEEAYTFRRNERPHLGAIVSAYYLVVPFAWFLQYKKYHAYEFECRLATIG